MSVWPPPVPRTRPTTLGRSGTIPIWDASMSLSLSPSRTASETGFSCPGGLSMLARSSARVTSSSWSIAERTDSMSDSPSSGRVMRSDLLDHEIGPAVHPDELVGVDQNGRVDRLDDSWTVDDVARLQSLAPDDRRLGEATPFEVDVTNSDHSIRGVLTTEWMRPALGLLQLSDASDEIGACLDSGFAVRCTPAVAEVVATLELGPQRVEVRLVELLRLEGDADLVHLSAVAHLHLPVQDDPVVRDALRFQVGTHRRLEAPVDLVEPVEVERREHRVARLAQGDEIRSSDPECGEDRRVRGYDDRECSDLQPVGTDVQGAGAAEREQGEVTRVVPPSDGLHADEVRHPRVDDLDHPHRGLDHRDSEGLCDPRADRLLCKRLVEIAHPTEEERGIDPSERDVCIGDGRLEAACAIRHRPGVRAG